MEQAHCPDGEVLVRLAGIVLAEALALGLSDDVHRGGYLCIADNATGAPLDVVKLGIVKPEKESVYERRVLKKARWLGEAPSEYLTSWQLRDPECEVFGGAVRVSHVIAFSGLPEMLDEALVLVVARAYMGWMNADVIRKCVKMAELGGNTLYGRLHMGLRQPALFAMLTGVHANV